MSNQVYISQDANEVNLVNTDKQLIITEVGNGTSVNVTQPITSVITVASIGPQGQPGPTGPQGPSGSLQPDSSGSFGITGSLMLSGSNPLTVIGPVVFTGSLNVTQGITGSLLGTATNALTASYTTNISGGSTGYVPLWKSNSTLGTSSIHQDDGNVGIGTLLPEAKLHVKGPGSTDLYTSFIVQNSNGNPSFVILGSGHVGIENLAPSYELDVTGTGRFTNGLLVTGSLRAPSITGSLEGTASYATKAGNAGTIDIYSFASPVESYLLMSNVVATTGVAVGGDSDLRYNSSTNVLTVPNLSATNITGSLLGTASFAVSASYLIGQSPTSSYALTASYLNPLSQDVSITGNLSVNGTASISYLNVFYESASIIYSSGSNQFGDAANDTQTLYGTVVIPTGSLTVTGSVAVTGGITGSFSGSGIIASASFASTASYVNPLVQNVQVTGSIVATSTITGGGSTAYTGITATAFGATATLGYGGVGSAGGTTFDIFQNGVAAIAVAQDKNVAIGAGSGNAAYGVARLLVKGSGTTPSTTALLVQNSNASASLSVKDDGVVTIGEGYAKTITLTPNYGTTSSRIKGGYGNGYLDFGGIGVGNITKLVDNIVNVGSIDVYGTYTGYGAYITNYIGTEKFLINSGSITVFSVSGSGNVGIGTSTPSYKVQVGDLTSNNSNKVVIATLNTGVNGFYVYASSNIRAGIESDYANTLTRVIGAYNGGTNIIGQDSNNGNTLLYSGASSTERARIEGSTGNILVGTTTGSARLTVKGSGATSSTTSLLVQNSAGTQILNVADDGILTVGTNSNNSGALLFQWPRAGFNGIFYGDSSSIIYGSITLDRGTGEMRTFTGTTYFPTFYSSGAEAMRIATTRNILVGTTTDSGFKLDISGSGRFTNGLTVTGSLTVTGGITGSLFGTSSWSVNALTASYALNAGDSVWTGSAGNIYYSGGNVGIGTSSPAYKLDVSGYGRFTSGIVVAAGQRISLGGSDYGSDALYSVGGAPLDVRGYYYTRFTKANNTLGVQVIQVEGQALIKGSGTTSSTTALLVQNANATASLAVLDNGNVGIGTSAPSASLQIGDGTTGARTLYIGGAISSDQVVGFNVNNTVYHRILSNANTGEFRLDAGATGGGHYLTVRADGTEQMRVKSTGVGIGTTAPSSKLHVVGNTILSGSAGTGSALYAYKSGSTVVDIQGSQGQLFSVVDALSGSLMSVNDISGLPILEVFSDDRVVMGTYGNAGLIVTGSDVQISASLFGTRQTGSLATGSTLLYTINTGSYTAGFFDYFVNSGSNYRAGNIMAVFGAGTYKFTDLATPDIGSTTNLQFSMSMAGASAQLYASASSAGWTVKTTFRTI